ncbi:glycosyltransferase, partial [Methylovulum psychrotolerans]
MKKVISVTPDLSENKISEASALDNIIGQAAVTAENGVADPETNTDTSDSEGFSGVALANGQDKSIVGYIEYLDKLQIHGWVIDSEGSPLKLALSIDKQSYQISYTWLDRIDIAEQHGDKYLTSGFRIDIPQGLIDVFEQAIQNGKRIDVTANGITLYNKITQPSAEVVLAAPEADNLTEAAELSAEGVAEAEEATAETAELPAAEAVAEAEEVPAETAELPAEAVAEAEEVPAETVTPANAEELPFEQQDLTIIGIVEEIDALHIRGWAIAPDAQGALTFSLRIGGVNYPLSPIWSNRVDIAFQHGEQFLQSGFKLDIPNSLAPTFLLARQNSDDIDVLVNGTLLDTRLLMPSPKVFPKNAAAERVTAPSLQTSPATDNPETGDIGHTKAPTVADNAVTTIQPPIGATTETVPTSAGSLSAAETDALLSDNRESIIGYAERIENTDIYGWVVNLEKTPLKLSLSIDGVVYPIAPIWSRRTDIAEAFHDDSFLQSGFKIETPASLAETLLLARHNGLQIAVIANDVILQNQIQDLDLDHKASPAIARNNTPITINGYVENIDQLCLYGWAINQGQPKTALKLFLRIDGVSYAVTPEWLERLDIAGTFGEAFLQAGFKITVPKALIDTFLQACENGKAISVIANDVCLNNSSLPSNFDPHLLGAELATEPNKYQTVFAINATSGVEIEAEDFQKLLTGQISYPLHVSYNDRINAHYYLERAKQKLIVHDIGAARTLLKISLTFGRQAEVLELLGNTYFEQKDYETAAHHYEAAAASHGNPSKWLVSNLMHCKKLISHPKEVIEVLLAAIARNPESGNLRERFDELVHEYWMKQQGALEAYAVTDDRDGLVAKMADVSSFIYSAYLQFYGASEQPQWVGGCNLERVLIVGDFHIQQCVRYRIDQKIEQLEAAGKTVTAVSWTDLADQQNALAFYDVVIFYRVPAEPPVLKAIAQVNATGRLSIYEIDDLLFDTAYPPPIETYGGYLDLNIYLMLMKGMASFNAAAHYCRFGLASTQLLADQLEKRVFGGRCFVHRNGTDQHNLFKHKVHDGGKDTLDIFYGSGTMAHNSDFTDLALPAVSRLLDEYPQVGLKIAGYLKLPESFLSAYPDRVKQMPPVKSIKAYWSMLERADISLAVLHDDLINGCKSELKWFEAACLGIPSVVSSTANYRDIIKDGEDGFIAATSDDWYRHLKALVDDPALRQAVADRAQARVRAEYSTEALADNLTAVLGAALAAAQQPGQKPRKKVALVNVFFPPQSIGGATRVVADNFDLLRRDYADDFDITVFTSDADFKPPYQMTQYNHQGVRVYRATVLWRENMDWHPADDKMGELFTEYLEAERPDLVHFHCVQRLTASVVEAARSAQIPYLVTVHDAWWISDYQFLVDADNTVYPDGHPDPYQPCTPPNNVSQLESVERILYLKGLLRDAKAALTVSNCFADIYRKNEIPQIRVNKNGISETLVWQSKDTRHTDKVVCGHVGGMAEHKGYFLLKAAVEALQPEHLEMLVVDHSQEEGYRLQTHWGQVPVTFIGRLGQTRVVELYRQLDVLFAPSTWPESYGLVTREAAACGCWIVASTMGGIGEDVVEGKSGFVVEPTLEALTACLEAIDDKPAVFKGKAHSPALRRVSEQVKELTDIYLDRPQEKTINEISGIDFDSIFEVNAAFDREISVQDFADLQAGLITFPLRISQDNAVNSAYYLALAKSYLDSHNIKLSIQFLRFAVFFDSTAAYSGDLDALPDLPEPITTEDFNRLLDGTAYPLRISENDGINAHYHFELAKHNVEQGKLQAAINLLRVGLRFEHHAESQRHSVAPLKQIDFRTVFTINAKHGVEITIEDFSKLLSGQISYPLRVNRDDATNARYYLEQAKQRLIAHDIGAARTLLKISLTFGRQAEVLELLGNTYFEQKDYETAAHHYEAAAASHGNPSKWLVSNLMHCKKLITHPREVVSVMLDAISRHPEANAYRERFDELVHEYWMKQQGALEAYAVTDDRDGLVAKMADVSSFI